MNGPSFSYDQSQSAKAKCSFLVENWTYAMYMDLYSSFWQLIKLSSKPKIFKLLDIQIMLLNDVSITDRASSEVGKSKQVQHLPTAEFAVNN